jgi:uroporphyrinogen decarboxylase
MPQMTSLERATTMIHGGIPDRVPTNQHNYLMAARMAGIPLSECLNSGKLLAEAQLAAWRYFKHDILIVENGNTVMGEAMGCGIHYSDVASPRVVTHVLQSLGDIDKLQIPDPEKSHPLSVMLECMTILRKEIGDKVFIFGRADQAPLSLAAELRGHAEFLMDLTGQENASAIERLLDICLEATTRYAFALQKAGAHGTTLGEFGSDMVSPKTYRRYTLPRLQRFYSAMKAANFPATLHQCGNTVAVLPDMIASGAELLELDTYTNMHTAKELTQGKTCVLGMVNPGQVLHRGTPEIVAEQSKEAIEVLAPGGWFTIGPGCALMPETPEENVMAMIEATEKYGRYNSDGSLTR